MEPSKSAPALLSQKTLPPLNEDRRGSALKRLLDHKLAVKDRLDEYQLEGDDSDVSDDSGTDDEEKEFHPMSPRGKLALNFDFKFYKQTQGVNKFLNNLTDAVDEHDLGMADILAGEFTKTSDGW
jgi:hypothetical protein